MSLQVWLPLNGHFSNQGLIDCKISQSGVTFSDGNIGKAAFFDNDPAKKIYIENAPEYYDNFSWCCWCYLIDITDKSYQFVLSQGRDYEIYGFNIVINQSKKISLAYGNTDNKAFITTTYEMLSQWTHVAVTVGNNKILLYINGTLYSTYDMKTLDYKYSGNAFVIGKMSYAHTSTTTYFPFNGKICDVRIYNHCLSPREVHEISKGLILHYPLNSPYMEPVTNLYGKQFENGSASSIGGYSKIIKLDEDGTEYTNYSFTKQPATSNNWYYLRFDCYPFTAGKTYTISMDVRVNSCQNCALTLRHARLANDYFGCKTVNVVTSSLPGTGWHHYSLTQVIPESFVSSSQTKICTPLVEFYTGNLAVAEGETTVRSMDLDMKNVQVIEKDHDLPYQTIQNTVVNDCSGFGNDGIINLSTTPSWTKDSIRYRGCYKFSSSQFFTAGKGAKVTGAITISLWGYMGTWNGNGRLISCTEAGGWNIESNGGYISFPVYVSTVGYINAKSSILWTSLSSGWHHFAGTYDGLSAKLYLDGKLCTSISTGKSVPLAISYHANNTIFIGAEAGSTPITPVGNYFNGKISDVRIYSTALSDFNIQTLYKTSASLSNNGSLMVYGEVIEE